MSANQALSDRFALIAKMIDLLGEDSFRALAHAKASRIIGDLAQDLEPIAKAHDARKQLTQLEGIGPKIADKIIEFVATGKITELEELRAKVPAGLLPLMEIPGLGPKTVAVLWHEGNVQNLADLNRIIADGSILNLPRMGEKAVAKIKDSIAFAAEGNLRLPLGLAIPLAEVIIERLKKVKGVKQVAFAGSARRGKDTVGDIDILISTTDPAAASAAFREMPGVRQVLVSGDNKSSVRYSTKADLGRWEAEHTAPASEGGGDKPDVPEGTIQVDLKVIDESAYGAALMYFTGSKDHNVVLRQRALDMGLTLNEYGLFSEPSGASRRRNSPSSNLPADSPADLPPHKRGIKPVAAKTEEDIYKKLGLNWIPPEMRESRGEIEAFSLSTNPERKRAGSDRYHERKRAGRETKESKATKGSKGAEEQGSAATDRPTGSVSVIELTDIKSELHAHTTASDGRLSIPELAQGAKSRGFHTIAVTDHSKSSVIANGLQPDRLRKHIKAIHAAREEIKGIHLLAGSEVDILSDGSLDYDDNLLAALDIVVASPHAALSQDPATATKRLLKAIAHPMVHILGHPTGRLINKRAGLAPDMAAVIAAAKEHNVALEINAHWLRLDLRDTHVRAAVDAGCLIAIDCDVHEPGDFDNLRFGVATGRRGWLPAEQCLNTWSPAKLHAWLKSKRSHR